MTEKSNYISLKIIKFQSSFYRISSPLGAVNSVSQKTELKNFLFPTNQS